VPVLAWLPAARAAVLPPLYARSDGPKVVIS
jgi:hypothetical protein